MSQPDATTQRLLDATHLTIDELKAARREWRETNSMRRILNAEAERLIEQGRSAMESGSIAEFERHKGKLEGIREMIAAANAQHQ